MRSCNWKLHNITILSIYLTVRPSVRPSVGRSVCLPFAHSFVCLLVATRLCELEVGNPIQFHVKNGDDDDGGDATSTPSERCAGAVPAPADDHRS